MNHVMKAPFASRFLRYFVLCEARQVLQRDDGVRMAGAQLLLATCSHGQLGRTPRGPDLGVFTKRVGKSKSNPATRPTSAKAPPRKARLKNFSASPRRFCATNKQPMWSTLRGRSRACVVCLSVSQSVVFARQGW